MSKRICAYFLFLLIAFVLVSELLARKASSKTCYKSTDLGKKSYSGTRHHTESGRKCQHWRVQTPHSHSKKYSVYKHNYCRNPDSSSKGPWCYTTDAKVRWEYCGIPMCGTIAAVQRKHTYSHCYRKSDKGKKSYIGQASTTASGRKCQKWSSQTPHAHSQTVTAGDKNYCRNPDSSSGGPWCYTTDSKVRWEYCGIPRCSAKKSKKCYQNSDRGRSSYVGKVSKTISGRTCQHWHSQFPHKKTAHRSVYNHNYCRNPDNESGGPWCYTTDKKVRWEYCAVPVCKAKRHEKCFDRRDNGLYSYVGTKATTKSGRTCQHWKFQSPHKKSLSRSFYNHNYCRNPDNELQGPWCYTTDKKVRWEFCGIPKCIKDKRKKCYDKADFGMRSYVGSQSKTISGRTCQQWNVQYPHRKSSWVSVYPHNHCRNPDGWPNGPWCYTTDPKKRWESCGIPMCGQSKKPAARCMDDATQRSHALGEKWTVKMAGFCSYYRCDKTLKIAVIDKEYCYDSKTKRCIRPTKTGAKYNCADGRGKPCKCVKVGHSAYYEFEK